MHFKPLIILLLMLAGIMSVSAAISDSGKRLLSQCEQTTAMRRFPEVKNLGEQLRRMGHANGNLDEEAAGHAYELYSLIHTRDTVDNSAAIKSLKQLIDGQNPAITNPEVSFIIARTVALYYQLIESDMPQALNYAFKALNQSRTSRQKAMEVSALSTLASLYFQKQDSTGFTYACKAYEIAKKQDLSLVMYSPAVNMANYLYNRNQFEKALEYLKEGNLYAKQFNLKSEEGYLNSFFADIYYSLGQKEKAEKFHHLAIDDKESPVYDHLYSRVCYGIFLLNEKRWREALEMFRHSEKIMNDTKVEVFKPQIFNGISICAEKLGDLPTALNYFNQFHNVEIERLNEAKEKEFAILDLRSRVAEEKNKNAEQEIILLQRSRMIYGLLTIAVVLVLAVIGLIIYQRRRTRQYKAVIARYLENAHSETELRNRLEACLVELREVKPQSTGSSALNEEKAAHLFAELERHMKEQHLYRDPNLSLNSTAQLLMTNRTYLSQVVNSRAGKSFVAYVNEFRVNESVELLMDESNKDSLKEIGFFVGFSSPSNFYTLFKQKVGVSPSVFRNNYKSVSSQDLNSD